MTRATDLWWRWSRRPALMLLAAMLVAACTPAVRRNPVAAAFLPSPNHGPRPIALVVLHHTSIGDTALALATLRDPAQGVSAHYLISREGRLLQLVDERERAWHAGHARWGAIMDVNGASIGIELDNDGVALFPAAQIDALLLLLDDLRRRHHLTPLAFVSHADVAPGRKSDPSRQFPWRLLAQQGFGLWCDAPLPPAPAGFDVVLGLQALGYDTSAADAAADAFALHYAAPQGGVAALDPALVACVARRAREVLTP